VSEPVPSEIVQAYATLFDGLDQLGPGSTETREAVLALVQPRLPAAPAIADMGCGKGSASLDLAAWLPGAHITALDSHQGFIGELQGDRITAICADMAAPPLPPSSLDLVWCESAIYSIGRRPALQAWQPLLRPTGLVAFSDVTWTTTTPPAEAAAFWAGEYPAMATPDAVIADLEATGFTLTDQLTAPRGDWRAYYDPLRRRLDTLGPNATGALAEVIAIMRREIAIFDRYGDSYASTWFVAEG
jgi:SAM-dependent methyltransferase